MGLLDFPAQYLAWLDQALAQLIPDAGRLVIWGVLAGTLSMALYALLSPQQRLRRIREEVLEARVALDQHDGSFTAARPLIGRMFATAMKQLALVFTPALLASLPLLFLLVWLHGTFAYVPAEQARDIELRTDPVGYSAEVRQVRFESASGMEMQGAHYLVVRDGRGRVVVERELDAPVSSLHKKQWWNSLIANPLGYLPDDSPLHSVTIELPRQEFLDFGPWWLRTWEFVFFTTLVAASLAVKFLFRLV